MIVLEPDEAAVHGAARQDDAALAFAAVAVPAEDVEGVRGAHVRCHDLLRRVHPIHSAQCAPREAGL